jgi:hypothetical protein
MRGEGALFTSHALVWNNARVGAHCVGIRRTGADLTLSRAGNEFIGRTMLTRERIVHLLSAAHHGNVRPPTSSLPCRPTAR